MATLGKLSAFVLALLLAGCCSGLRIDRSCQAKSQDNRVQYLILHCTEEDWEHSLRILTQAGVSSHYLVRDSPVEVHQLVPEGRRAFHAGLSFWKGQTSLNASSIGIEIVNLGVRATPGQKPNPDYPKDQIDAVIALVKDICARQGIRPDHVLGHSDIAPQRKVDPGPRFPWKRLADEGLIPWPAASAVAARLGSYQAVLPNPAWFQARLAEIGYETPRNGLLDGPTRSVLAAFQMKYRPAHYDGQPDAETAAMLDVLAAQPPMPVL